MTQPTFLIVDSTEAGKVIKRSLKSEGFSCVNAKTNQYAIATLDKHLDSLRCIIVDIALAQNSAFEFLYEMRSYQDMSKCRVVMYASEKIPHSILHSLDWKLLDIDKIFYKSKHSVREVCSYATMRIHQEV